MDNQIIDVYQVLSRPRTGSGVLYHHAWQSSRGFVKRLGEYFNINDSDEEYEQKFKYLETEKQENKHYCIKVHTGQIRDIKRTINYLKDYHVYVADRDPWDTFLSYMFCELTNWEGPHKFADDTFGKWTKQGKQIANIDTNNFVLKITEEQVIKQVDVYKESMHIIKEITDNLPAYTIFNYNSLPKYNHTKPLGIDYESHVPDVQKYKTMFKELLND